MGGASGAGRIEGCVMGIGAGASAGVKVWVKSGT